MAIFIPYRCPKCFGNVTLVQPQHKGGALKGPAKGQCLNCMDEQEYDLRVPTNKRDLIHALKSSHPKQTLAKRVRSAGTGQEQTLSIYF